MTSTRLPTQPHRSTSSSPISRSIAKRKSLQRSRPLCSARSKVSGNSRPDSSSPSRHFHVTRTRPGKTRHASRTSTACVCSRKRGRWTPTNRKSLGIRRMLSIFMTPSFRMLSLGGIRRCRPAVFPDRAGLITERQDCRVVAACPTVLLEKCRDGLRLHLPQSDRPPPIHRPVLPRPFGQRGDNKLKGKTYPPQMDRQPETRHALVCGDAVLKHAPRARRQREASPSSAVTPCETRIS